MGPWVTREESIQEYYAGGVCLIHRPLTKFADFVFIDMSRENKRKFHKDFIIMRSFKNTHDNMKLLNDTFLECCKCT